MSSSVTASILAPAADNSLRHFGFQRDQHIVPRLERARPGGRRLDLAAHLPNRSISTSVEAELIQVDGLLERRDQLLCAAEPVGPEFPIPLLFRSLPTELLAVIGGGCIQARQALRAADCTWMRASTISSTQP